MSRNLYDIMTNDYGVVNEFGNTLAEMARTRYILAEKKISNALKLAAYSRILYDFFGKALKGFDYQQEVLNCQTSNNRLTMPADKKKLVALVFCLMNDIDSKNIYLNDFLRQFYRGDKDINMAYTLFCREVIEPFISACEELLSMGIDNYTLAPARNGEYTAEVADIINDINVEQAFTVKEKEELIFMLDKLGSLIRAQKRKAAVALYETVCYELDGMKMSAAGAVSLKNIEKTIIGMPND